MSQTDQLAGDVAGVNAELEVIRLCEIIKSAIWLFDNYPPDWADNPSAPARIEWQNKYKGWREKAQGAVL